MQAVIQASGLSKFFGDRKVLDDLSLSVYRGDIFGFLGPNGAGKSTTIRILTGLVKPDNGSAQIFGRDTWKEKNWALRPVGALVETPGLYRFLSGRENLYVSGKMIPHLNITKPEIDRVLKIVGLYERAEDKVKTYSHGMRQRLALASCLLGNPELLILDEPTNGLDPEGMREIRELIKSLSKEQGMTIFLSSHLLNEVQQICNRVAIINNGKSVLQGEVKELLSSNATWQLEVSDPSKAVNIIRAAGLGTLVSQDGNIIRIKLQKNNSAELNSILVQSGIQVSELQKVTISLEELYMSLSGKN